jgi:hypothetical protein
MIPSAGDPTEVRNRLVRAIGPETVALALIVTIGLAILLGVWVGSRQANPSPSIQPGASAAALTPAR